MPSRGKRSSFSRLFWLRFVHANQEIGPGLKAGSPFAGADGFIQKNCAACHNSPSGPGRLDLAKLGYEPANPDNFAVWVKVHDRVSAGEMPPAGIPGPGAESIARFVKGLETALSGYERSVTTERGRAGLRRLNAYEYENAIRDLLGVPWVQIKAQRPQDGEAYRFNKIVIAAGITTFVPTDESTGADQVYARDKIYRSVPPLRRLKFISPGLLASMRNHLIAGREFTRTDIYQQITANPKANGCSPNRRIARGIDPGCSTLRTPAEE